MKWTLEEEEKLKELYGKGLTLDAISVEMCRERDAIKKHVSLMQMCGKLGYRGTPKTKKREEQMAKLKPDIVAGKLPYKVIAKKFGISETTVRAYAETLRGLGELENRPKRVILPQEDFFDGPRQKQKGTNGFVYKDFKKVEIATPTLPDGKPVKCNAAISRQCVYGVESNGVNIGNCRFAQCTGKCRSVTKDDFIGCPAKACIRFSKISKDNPRRYSVES